MDGDRDRDTHWNTGLNSLGPNEKQMKGEREQGRQNQREPSSMMDGDRDRDPHWNTGLSPQFPKRSRMKENIKKEVRTARGASTH